ncbi:MAG: hypothetical protein QM762_24430 [Chryseolinea sp.]
MEDIFPLGKRRYVILLSALVAINVAYWIVFIYWEDPYPSVLDVLLGIVGFCSVGPLMVAMPAAIIALIPIASRSYKQRLLRHTLGLWLGINLIFVVLMIMSLADQWP